MAQFTEQAWIEIETDGKLLVTQFLAPDHAHEAQQELEYKHGLIARVVRMPIDGYSGVKQS